MSTEHTVGLAEVFRDGERVVLRVSRANSDQVLRLPLTPAEATRLGGALTAHAEDVAKHGYLRDAEAERTEAEQGEP